MKLRSKLLLGFSLVVAVMIVIGVIMNYSLSNIGQRSRAVDTVDSGLVQALAGQGHVLRFLAYQDMTYANQAGEAFTRSKEYFLEAAKVLQAPENQKLLQDRLQNVENLTSLFAKSIAFNKERIEVDASLVPITSRLNAVLKQLQQNIAQMLTQNFVYETFVTYNIVNEIGDVFLNARMAARLYVGSPTPEGETRALNLLKSVADTVHKLDGRIESARNTELVNELLVVLGAYETGFRNLIVNAREAQQVSTTLRNQFIELTDGSIKLSNDATIHLLSDVSVSQTTMMVGTALTVLLSLLIAILLTRNVLLQLGKDPGELAIIARRVTGGDFNIDDGSPSIGVYGNIVNMVGTLETNINKAQEESQNALVQSQKAAEAMLSAEAASKEAQSKAANMSRAADKLESVVNIVSSASEELSAQIEQSERGATEQAARVTETATAMEEMNSTVLEVARNAAEASEVSTSTRQKAEAGAEIVRKSVQSIQAVQTQAVRLKSDMTTLDENAKSISQIMAVISDIADQTNLLALNAAIEAARAGEAGRGFAVVADEVRKLAEKTMASTTDVGNAIRAIQQSAAQSMTQVDSSVKSIEEATEYANQSGAALSEIVNMVDRTADQVRAIATASEQQSASSEEINQSIIQVNTIAGETSRAMQEASHAVSDLASQSQVLGQLIEDMKRG